MFSNIEDIRLKWKRLYSETLPAKAKARDRAQKYWPVMLDHCFARIVLDKVIGDSREPWTKRLKSPAAKHMTEDQLLSCIELAENTESGNVDLVELNQDSLNSRGFGNQRYDEFRLSSEAMHKDLAAQICRPNLKRKSIVTSNDTQGVSVKKRQSTLNFAKTSLKMPSPMSAHSGLTDDHCAMLNKIKSHPSLTPYRKRLYMTLMSLPRGRYTTYAAISDYLKSSARAVGSGMRNNPFAPQVPCHRVLAADGSIGGFGGSWGKDGKYSDKKAKLLNEEGVKFDRKGKAVGEPFREFRRLT